MKKVNKRWIVLCIGMTAVILTAFKEPDDTYPTEHRLFYIERSKNKNIVCYDYNVTDEGKLNLLAPLNVYWINREQTPGRRGELNYIQRSMAYGYSVVKQDNEIPVVALQPIKNRTIAIEADRSRQFICKMEIDNQWADLQKIYVKT
ncbi:MAG: DUF4833 domain-containing protein [Bacteroidales bacterium]|nr:DUF4833 domain-containing protein [Bacteroidales bacterium]